MEKNGINPKVIMEIRELAYKYHMKKVVLFGSRARGDFREKSDIDLAAIGDDFTHFALAVDNETSTLLEFDIVNLNKKVSEELLESIEKEGITLYEEIS